MSKPTRATIQKAFTFYRPHNRVYADIGTIIDKKTGELLPMPSRTKQSFVDECDINNILKQFSKTGMLRHVSAKAQQGAYQDLPDDVDFQDALNTVLAGQNAFATLPSKVRARFHNDPAEFLEFMADSANQDEAIKLGLATDNRIPPGPAPEDSSSSSSSSSSKPPEAAPKAKTGGEGGPPLA